MKVCMVAHAYYPHNETRVQREAEALLDRGYTVDVLCLKRGDEPMEGSHNGVYFYRLPVKRHQGSNLVVYILEYISFFLLSFYKLSVLHCKKNYNVIHFHSPPDFLIFSAILPKLLGSKLILDFHDLMPEMFSAKYNLSKSNFLIKLIECQEKLSAKFADRCIAVNKRHLEGLLMHGNVGKKFTILMNLPDEKIFRRERKQRDETLVVMYHGTIIYRYGVDIAVKAISVLRKEGFPVELRLYGRGECQEQIESLIKELGLERIVKFKQDFLPVEHLPKLINKATVGVVPNRKDVFTNYILPTKLLEYIVMGVPTIIARTKAVETYFDDSMVMFFEPGNERDLADKIRLLCEYPNKREELMQNALRFFEKYNWESEKEKYVKLIDSLLK